MAGTWYYRWNTSSSSSVHVIRGCYILSEFLIIGRVEFAVTRRGWYKKERAEDMYKGIEYFVSLFLQGRGRDRGDWMIFQNSISGGNKRAAQSRGFSSQCKRFFFYQNQTAVYKLAIFHFFFFNFEARGFESSRTIHRSSTVEGIRTTNPVKREPMKNTTQKRTI